MIDGVRLQQADATVTYCELPDNFAIRAFVRRYL